MDMESVLKKLGMVGKFQAMYMGVITLASFFPSTWHMISIVWIGHKPPHHCKIPLKSSMEEWIPRDKDGKFDSCLMFPYPSIKNKTVACVDGWQYDLTGSGPTIVSKWNMVCDDQALLQLSQTFLAFGVMIGAVVFSIFADKFGRKPVFISCSLLIALFGSTIVLVQQVELFLFLRFIIGMLQQGLYLVGVIMSCEMFSNEQRVFTGLSNSMLWGLAMSVMPLIAFVAQNWAYCELFISLYGYLWIPLYWWIPETLPWLIANNRIEKAERIVEMAAKINNIDMPLNVFEKKIENYDEIEKDKNIKDKTYDNNKPCDNKQKEIDNNENNKMENNKSNEQGVMQKKESDLYTTKMNVHESFNYIMDNELQNSKKESIFKKLKRKIFNHFSINIDKNKTQEDMKIQYSILELFTCWLLLKNLLLCSIIGFIANLTFYGLTLTSGSLFGNRFLNGFLDGFIIVPSTLIAMFAVNRFGRLIPYKAFFFLAGISLILRLVIKLTLGDTETGLSLDTALSIIGKFGAAGGSALHVLVMTELFPTNLRSQAVGICSFMSKLGNLVASYSTLMIEMYPNVFLGILGGSTLLASLISFLLPETHGKALPDTIIDIEELYKGKKKEDK